MLPSPLLLATPAARAPSSLSRPLPIAQTPILHCALFPCHQTPLILFPVFPLHTAGHFGNETRSRASVCARACVVTSPVHCPMASWLLSQASGSESEERQPAPSGPSLHAAVRPIARCHLSSVARRALVAMLNISCHVPSASAGKPGTAWDALPLLGHVCRSDGESKRDTEWKTDKQIS